MRKLNWTRLTTLLFVPETLALVAFSNGWKVLCSANDVPPHGSFQILYWQWQVFPSFGEEASHYANTSWVASAFGLGACLSRGSGVLLLVATLAVSHPSSWAIKRERKETSTSTLAIPRKFLEVLKLTKRGTLASGVKCQLMRCPAKAYTMQQQLHIFVLTGHSKLSRSWSEWRIRLSFSALI